MIESLHSRSTRRSGARLFAACAVLLITITAIPAPAVAGPVAPAIHRATTSIQHFLFLMQGDRSFDNYFGTYPGADGLPATACQQYVVARPSGGCVKPFSLHGSSPQPLGAGTTEIARQYDGGKMDGFVSALQGEGRDGTAVMGHYDQRDLPTYWAIAQQYVLFDQFFSSTRAGQRANRSYWVAAGLPPGVGAKVPATGYGDQATIFDRLQAAGVSWKVYVEDYNPTQTFRTASAADPATQTARVPLLNYARFVDNPALNSHIVNIDQYYRDLHDGTLPAVAYIASSGSSERSARSLDAGQKLVSDLVQQLALSPYWGSSALLWSYDGSGGWYDHVSPPQVDGNGYGLRVPALLVSAYARKGQVNHTVLDYTSALAFVEKNWGLAPLTTRDASANTLLSAFDFGSGPRPARLLPGNRPADSALTDSVWVVYWFYGAAAVAALACLMVAALRSRSIRRRQKVAATERSPEAPVGVDAP